MKESKIIHRGVFLIAGSLLFFQVLSACSKSPSVVGGSGQAKDQSGAEGAAYYTCTMHPEVHSDKPGECPICHMTLVKTFHSKAAHQVAQSGIKSRADVQLTEQQLALSGISLVKVEEREMNIKISVPGRVVSGGRIAFQVREEDLTFVKAGLNFKAKSTALMGKALAGKITSVDSILDPMTRTVRVNAAFNSDLQAPKLPVESTLLGVIEVPMGRVLSIPEGALFHNGSEDIVYLSKGSGEFSPKLIRTGVKSDGYYEVKEGLKPGDLVSGGPNFLLDSESRVRAAGEGLK